MKSFLIFLIFLYAVAIAYSTNFCAKHCIDYIKNETIPNIGCEKTKDYYKTDCPDDAKIINFPDHMKQILVDAHNSKRNHIAGGGDPKLKPACRMATMQWDDELAYLAYLHVKRCKFDHDSCQTTDKYEYPGQNLMIAYVQETEKERLTNAVQSWYDEIQHVSQSIIDSFVSGDRYLIMGHFGAIMVERNTRLGCAAATYKHPINGLQQYLLTCNYATSAFPERPVYSSCHEPGLKCTTGRNPAYQNLCSVSEVYDVNSY